MPQVIAAVQTWQTQLQSGLTIPGLSPSATAIIQAELNAADGLLTTLEAAEKSGGTTQALADVFNNATPIYESDSLSPLTAMMNPVHLVRQPRAYKLKNGVPVYAWAHHRDVLIVALSKKTGDKATDKTNAAILAAVKKLS